MSPRPKPHLNVLVRTGFDTLGTEDAIEILIHAPSWILKHRTPVEVLAIIKAGLCLALAADLGVFSPYLKGSHHGGDTDESGEGAMIEAKGPSLKKERYPYCPQNEHRDEPSGEVRAVRNPIPVIHKNEDNEETYSKPQVLQPTGILEIEPQSPLSFPPQAESLHPLP